MVAPGARANGGLTKLPLAMITTFSSGTKPQLLTLPLMVPACPNSSGLGGQELVIATQAGGGVTEQIAMVVAVTNPPPHTFAPVATTRLVTSVVHGLVETKVPV